MLYDNYADLYLVKTVYNNDMSTKARVRPDNTNYQKVFDGTNAEQNKQQLSHTT